MSSYELNVNGDIILTPSAGNNVDIKTGVDFFCDPTFSTGSSTANWRTGLGVAIGSDVQAYDADLAAIAGLTSAADKGIQFTGSGTAATYDLTAAGKALLDDANAAAQRTTLGLGSLATASTVNNGDWSGTDLAVANGGTGSSSAADARTALGVAIGSDVQAYDAGLASIAGLTTAANKMIYATASDTYAVADLTAAGRAILDDATAAAQRTTLSAQTLNANLTSLADMTAPGAGEDGEVVSWNQTSGEFEMIAASGTTYTAGDGLDLTGTAFSTDLKSAGGLTIVSTELAIDTAVVCDLTTAQDLTNKTLDDVNASGYIQHESGTADFDAVHLVKKVSTSSASNVNVLTQEMGQHSVCVIKGRIVGMVNGGGDVGSYEFNMMVKRGNAVGDSEVLLDNITESEEDATWVGVSVSADTTNGGFTLDVGGKAGTDIDWCCVVEVLANSYDGTEGM